MIFKAFLTVLLVILTSACATLRLGFETSGVVVTNATKEIGHLEVNSGEPLFFHSAETSRVSLGHRVTDIVFTFKTIAVDETGRIILDNYGRPVYKGIATRTFRGGGTIRNYEWTIRNVQPIR